MDTLAIEINDAGLVVANQQGLLAVEPGYALVEHGQIATGLSAYGQARIKPRQVSSRYWSSLSLDTSAVVLEGVRSTAQLAFTQLNELWRRYEPQADNVILIVPGHFKQQELGLLLGLAQECGMEVLAMIDAAVAASPRPYPGRQLVYVDAGLHRVSVTPLEQSDEVKAQTERGLEETGLASLTDLLAKRLAEIFVLGTRFDPFHDAESEQLLYDRLPQWLALLHEQGAAQLSLPYGNDEFSVEVQREQLLAVASGFYRALLQLVAQTREPGSSLVVQLSDRLAQLPGLVAELSRLDDAEVVALSPGHAARSSLLSLSEIESGQGQVKLLRHLSWREKPAEPGPRTAQAPVAKTTRANSVTPTHVVYRGVAYPVDSNGLIIGRSQTDDRRAIILDDQTSGVSRSHCELSLRDGELRLRDLSSHGTFINEKRVSGEETLHPADIIRIGSPGAELEVVRVEYSGGA